MGGFVAKVLCPNLIGRESEMAALTRSLDLTRAGDGRIVLVSGEAGIGKSALLRALAQSVRNSGVAHLSGECVEIDARRPFGPFVQILEAATLDQPDLIERSLRDGAGELLRLLPSRRGRQTKSEPTHGSERYRIHESFVRLFSDFARVCPLVLAVDDLQWADEATLELVPYLAGRLRHERVLIVASYRSEEPQPSHSLNAAIRNVDRIRTAERITLSPLDIRGTGVMIRDALSLTAPPDKGLVAAVYARCEGNPFFIEEVLRALLEHGAVSRDGAWQPDQMTVGVGLPASVRAIVEQRMSRLGAEARKAVQVAAGIGATFDFALVQAVVGVADAGLVASLRAAIDAQILQEIDDREERYRFRHALTREAVLGQLLGRERRLLHHAIGVAIEEIAGADVGSWSEDLSDQFDQAGDTERAYRYHDLAATEAKSRFAFVRELLHLDRAVELAVAADATLAELQLRLSRAAAMSSELSRARDAAEEAARLFEAAGDSASAGAAIAATLEIRFWMGDWNGPRTAQRAVQLLAPFGDSPSLSDVYSALSGQAVMVDDTAGAIAHAERALGIARRTGAVRSEVHALYRLGGALVQSADNGGLLHFRDAFDLALRHDLVYEVQIVCRNALVSFDTAGAARLDGVRMHEQRVEHAARHAYRPTDLIKDLCAQAYGVGDWDAALELAEEVSPESIWSAVTGLLVATMMVARDGPERGIPLLEEHRARLRASEQGAPQWTIWAESSAAGIALLGGDRAKCLAHAELVEALVRGDFWLYGVSHAAIYAISAARELRDDAALRQWIELALTEPKRPRARHLLARRSMAHAEQAAAAGDLDSAINELSRCAEHLAAGILAPSGFLPTTFVRLRLAEILLSRDAPGDREEAESALAADVPYLRRAKATWYLGALRMWADSHGLAFPSDLVSTLPTPNRPHTDRLTARERQVATLVAQGLTNRAIADVLVISERTVEGHVEQVRNKLGFHSRTQIAAWVARGMSTTT